MVKRHDSSIQPTLFKRSLKEVLKETGTGINELNLWYRNGWLSFDANKLKEFDDKECTEILFIKGLVRLGLPKKTILFMLSQLEKPYCYSYGDVYWDFHNSEWKEFRALLEKKMESEIDDLVASNLASYLETLAADDNSEELARITDLIKQLNKDRKRF